MKFYDTDGVYLGLTWEAEGWWFAEDRLALVKGHETERDALRWLRDRRRVTLRAVGVAA